MTVQLACSWWKAYNLFRKLGLRHLPVVDDCNRVRGILTRKDFHVLEAH
jgi:CBS domain-containing protein